MKIQWNKPFVLGICVFALPLLSIASDSTTLKEEARSAISGNDFKAAESLYSKITVGSPEDADAWHGLGNSLDAQGRTKEADVAYLRASELYAKEYEKNPSDPALLYELVLSTMCAGDGTRAKEYLEAGVAKFPDNKDLAGLNALLNGRR